MDAGTCRQQHPPKLTSQPSKCPFRSDRTGPRAGNGSTFRQQQGVHDVWLWSSSVEISHLGFVVLSDLSDAVFSALNDALPNDDLHLVRRVEVFEGWARIPFVTVNSGMSRKEAGAALAERIHAVVAGIMDGCRHDVRIIWAQPS